MPPDVPSYLSSQGTLSDRQETVVRTEGGHQANGHIESNGKASAPDAAVFPGAAPPGAGVWHHIMHSGDLACWMTLGFLLGFMDFAHASCAGF